MEHFLHTLATSPLVYVTRDIERAVGLPLHTPGYFIISNSTPFAKQIAADRPNILLIEHSSLLDTHELLRHSDTERFLEQIQKPVNILVFKNTTLIETICREKQWHLINPPSSLAHHIEEKITQLSFLPSLKEFFLPYTITTCEQIVWNDAPLVVQFNHSHTGNGTVLIDSEERLRTLQTQFPKRDARVAPFIEGPILTNNNIVAPTQTLVGNISYQITGIAPFTKRPFATIGNDWHLPHTLLNDEQHKEYHHIATRVGDTLRDHGWKGLFGIDVLVDEATGKLHLLEINARQAASASYESILQDRQRATDNERQTLTVFEAHLASLLSIDISSNSVVPIHDGAQIIVRSTEETSHIDEERFMSLLEKHNEYVIPYTDTSPESDNFRIQSTHGLMAAHNVFNEYGNTIRELVLASLS